MSGTRPVRPDREAFRRAAAAHTIVPVIREIAADWWTPVAVFQRLSADDSHAFLLESVEGGARVGRYSFVGRSPFLIARGRGDELTLSGPETDLIALPEGTPLKRLRHLLAAFRSASQPDLPPFVGGAVGYFGYDAVRWTERLPEGSGAPADEDDFGLLFLSELVAFDHVHQRLALVVNARPRKDDDVDAAYAEAVSRLERLEDTLHQPWSPPREHVAEPAPLVVESNRTQEEFENSVRRAKEHIAAGDVFQVVLSQRFSVPNPSDDVALYRSLRTVNPSPYMFLLRMGEWSAVGSSPEPLVRVRDRKLSYRPIAGTVPRGGTPAEDRANAEALRNDPKERAEHVMLVDLGRNDLGRCAVTGSVTVDELMTVERYSHVMHLVSGLSAELHPEMDALDALLACFPAGTVSGAPKVRAMEIIAELEPDRRGLYSGAVGYLDFSGNLDTCIALRTMVVRPDRVTVQAGAGIVADSDPTREYEETRHKARALLEAIRMSPRFAREKKR